MVCFVCLLHCIKRKVVTVHKAMKTCLRVQTWLHHFHPQHKIEMVVSSTYRQLYPRGKPPRYPVGRRLDRLQSRSGLHEVTNSLALVREQTICTEVPPLVGELVLTFAGRMMSCSQLGGPSVTVITVF
jgi:hypothetical protein